MVYKCVSSCLRRCLADVNKWNTYEKCGFIHCDRVECAATWGSGRSEVTYAGRLLTLLNGQRFEGKFCARKGNKRSGVLMESEGQILHLEYAGVFVSGLSGRDKNQKENLLG